MKDFPRYNEGAFAGHITAYATTYGAIQRAIQTNPDVTVEEIKEMVYDLYLTSKRKAKR